MPNKPLSRKELYSSTIPLAIAVAAPLIIIVPQVTHFEAYKPLYVLCITFFLRQIMLYYQTFVPETLVIFANFSSGVAFTYALSNFLNLRGVMAILIPAALIILLQIIIPDKYQKYGGYMDEIVGTMLYGLISQIIKKEKK